MTIFLTRTWCFKIVKIQDYTVNWIDDYWASEREKKKSVI